ncbi:MAG TPA: Smr/MutS family protein [Planctomycetota bacterium]|nr:Smr/MutS family protein [Planctomycetota bacterium]
MAARKEPPTDWEREIDLHGLNIERAQRRLGQDLYMARARGERTVVVITGMGWNSRGGTGVLRPAVERWLRGPDGQALGVHSLESIAKDGAWRVHLLPVGSQPT